MSETPTRANVVTKLINAAVVSLRRQLSISTTMTQDEAHGALGSALLLQAVDFTHRAGVPEAAMRVWFEECVSNIYRRGVDIKTWREPS